MCQTANFVRKPCIYLISTPFSLSPLTRWIWCLYHCVLRKCHTGAVYRRDCRRSDWLWIPGYYTHLVLLSSWWWCFGTGNGKLLLTCLLMSATFCLLHGHGFYSSATYVMSKGVGWQRMTLIQPSPFYILLSEAVKMVLISFSACS